MFMLKIKQYQDRLPVGRSAFTAICLAVIMVSAEYDVMGTGNCELKIFTRNSKADLNDIKSFFRNADLVVSRTLPAEPVKNDLPEKLPIYNIVLMNEKDFKKIEIMDEGKNGIRYYLPEDISKWADNDRIKAKIIASMILKKAHLNLETNINQLPPWLVYGILSKVNRRLDKANIPGIITFPALHMLLITSPPPDLLEIAAKPAYQDDGPIYQVFLESSEVIVDTLRRLPKSRESIIDVINLSLKGFPPKNAFIEAFAKKVYVFKNNTSDSLDTKNLQSSEVLNQWLIENAILLAVNSFNPGNASFAEKQFRKIEMVKYIAVPNREEKDKKEERLCRVDEILEKKKEMENFNAVIRVKEVDFARLAFSLPEPLQPGILKIKEALEMLRGGVTENFAKRCRDAKQEFYSGLEKMNQLETYLSKLELEALPPSWKYSWELDETRKWNNKVQNRWPALTKYLDAIENE